MNKISNNENQWQPCEDGQIRRAGESIRKQRQIEARRKFLRGASTAAVAVVGAGFVGWTLMGPKASEEPSSLFTVNPASYGGIACRDVVRLLPDYIALSIEDSNAIEAIEVHLAKCEPCRRLHASMANLG